MERKKKRRRCFLGVFWGEENEGNYRWGEEEKVGGKMIKNGGNAE